MLASLHALLIAMVEFRCDLVAVHGQCLGGGLEVALAGGRSSRHQRRSSANPRSSWVSSPPRQLPAAVAREPGRREDCCGRRSVSGLAGTRSAWCIRWPTTRSRGAGVFR